MIDLSQLPPEKRRFLENNPELLESLETAVPQQVQQMNKRQAKLDKSKAKWQQDLGDVDRRVADAKFKAEELRRKYDPHLMEIEKALLDRTVVKTALVCPDCGEPDKGNKQNGKPWCFKCNETLVSPSKVKDFKRIRVLPKDLRDELKRLKLDPNP